MGCVHNGDNNFSNFCAFYANDGAKLEELSGLP